MGFPWALFNATHLHAHIHKGVYVFAYIEAHKFRTSWKFIGEVFIFHPRWESNVENFWDDVEFEAKLNEGVILHKKPHIGYRIFLGVCGILFFLAGWVMWNIALPAEGESGAVDTNSQTLLFFTGLFVQFILGPYFAFVSVSQKGRLSPLIPKELRQYNALKHAITNKKIHDLYWAALSDPTHEYHNEIIRYKWMDKLRWKHYPADFFGYQKFTKESGEETLGRLVPKSSDAYRNSNFTLDENSQPVFDGPKHPLGRVTLPMILLLLSISSLTQLPLIASMAIASNDMTLMMEALRMIPILFVGLFVLWRNTALLDAFRRESKPEDLSLEALEQRLNLLREKYVAVREHEDGRES